MDKSDLVAWAETLSAASPRLPGDEIVRRVNALAKFIRKAEAERFHEVYSGLKADDERIVAARRRERERCAQACDRWSGPPHTMASENADHYRGFASGAAACADAIRALPDEP